MDFQWISIFSQGQIFVSYMFKIWEARLEEAKKENEFNRTWLASAHKSPIFTLQD